MEHIITEANFESEVLQSSTPVLVDFWAPWCGPCRMQGPIIEQLATEMDAAQVKIGKCNVDENGSLAMKYGIMSIPALMVFKNGQVVEQLTGLHEKEDLRNLLTKHVA